MGATAAAKGPLWIITSIIVPPLGRCAAREHPNQPSKQLPARRCAGSGGRSGRLQGRVDGDERAGPARRPSRANTRRDRIILATIELGYGLTLGGCDAVVRGAGDAEAAARRVWGAEALVYDV